MNTKEEYIDVELEVTEEEIKKDRHCWNNCPVTMAFRKVLKDEIIYIDTGYAITTLGFSATNDKMNIEVKLPKEVSEWIEIHDFSDQKLGLAKSFKFKVKLPKSLIKEQSGTKK